jgi:hypothetical protein
VTPTARVVDLAAGQTTTFTVSNEGAAGSLLRWSFTSAHMDAWPAAGTLAAGASETVLVVVPLDAEGTVATGRFAAPRQAVEVSVDVVRGPPLTCDPEAAFAAHADAVRVLVGYRHDPPWRGAAATGRAAGGAAGFEAARAESGRATTALGAAFGAAVERLGRGTEFDLLRVPPGAVDALLDALRARSDVAFALRDVPIARAAAPNDALYGAQWNLSSFGAEPAWAAVDAPLGDVATVVVAIVDDGVAVAHGDLAARTLPGWDAFGNDGDVRNCTDHGTHVAGIAGAARGDGFGVAGVASVPWVRLLPVKAWPDTTDPLATTGVAAIVDAMRWAGGLPVTGFPQNDTPADVINLSLGTPQRLGRRRLPHRDRRAARAGRDRRGRVREQQLGRRPAGRGRRAVPGGGRRHRGGFGGRLVRAVLVQLLRPGARPARSGRLGTGRQRRLLGGDEHRLGVRPRRRDRDVDVQSGDLDGDAVRLRRGGAAARPRSGGPLGAEPRGESIRRSAGSP